MTETSAPEDTSSCPRCGAGLRCGMVAGDSKCWCFEMPHVIPVPAPDTTNNTQATAPAACLCAACLQLLIDSHEHNTVKKPFTA